MRTYAIKFDIFRKMPKDLTEATYSGALCNLTLDDSLFSIPSLHGPAFDLRNHGSKGLYD